MRVGAQTLPSARAAHRTATRAARALATAARRRSDAPPAAAERFARYAAPCRCALRSTCRAADAPAALRRRDAGSTPSTYNAKWEAGTKEAMKAQKRVGAPGTTIATNPIRHL